MDRGAIGDIATDDFDWRERSEYWRAHKPIIRGRPRKFKYREPIIICGHGAGIRVDHNTLLIRNGFTHYPQKSEEIRFFPGDPNLPDRIIILDGSGGISFDALNWMSEQEIEFVQLDWRGRVSSVGGQTGYSADRKLAEAQKSISGSRRGVEIARWLIREKIRASSDTLLMALPKSQIRENTISKFRKWISDLDNSRKCNSISKIHGIEGPAAVAYFQAWQGLRLKWGGAKRKPIPDSWREIGPRRMGWRKRSRAARHPVNAMLNYGYGVLISQVRAQIIAAGLDPSIGIMHGTSENRIPLVYDLMEPLRPAVDRQVLKFALSSEFRPADFTINRHGACRLNPQLARALVKNMSDAPKIAPIVTHFARSLSG